MRAHCDYNPYYDMLETIVNTWFETIYPNEYMYIYIERCNDHHSILLYIYNFVS